MWRKGKRTLNFDSERSNELKRLFCNELYDGQNSSQVSYGDEPVPVYQSCDDRSCKCHSLSTDMAGVQLELMMMQRDIRVNNSDLTGLSDIVNKLTREVREVHNSGRSGYGELC